MGRREEGVEDGLFKASLNTEVFLESLEYVVMVSADAVHSPKANIYISWIGACQPYAATASRLLFLIGCTAKHDKRQLMGKEIQLKNVETLLYPESYEGHHLLILSDFPSGAAVQWWRCSPQFVEHFH